jgi:hypothetical protein
MSKSRLIDILRTFNQSQIKRFGKFLNSPFFNTNQTIIKYYDIIGKYHPDFPEDQLDKKKIFESLYPGKAYNDGAMRNLVSDMVSLAHKFIIHASVTENSLDMELLLLSYFNQNKLDEQFEKKINKTENDFSKSLLNEEELFTSLRLLEREKQLFYSVRNRENIHSETSFRENLYGLYSYLFALFRSAHNALHHKYTFNDNSLYEYINKISAIININNLISFFKANKFEYSDILEMYYLSYLSLINLNDDKSFQQFRLSIEKNYRNFSEFALYNLMLIFENCCTFRIQEGRIEFIKKYIDFQKWLDRNNITSTPEKYYYNSLRFINTVAYGCYLKDFDWLEQYIKKYLNRLSPEYQKSIYHLTYAYIDFEKGKFDSSANHLRNVNYDHFLIKLYVRELSLLNYYETGNIESAYLMIDSFHHFLSTNKSVSEIHRKKYSKFLGTYKEVLGLKIGHSEKTVSSLRKDIMKNIRELRPRSSKWLLEKIDDLEKITNR